MPRLTFFCELDEAGLDELFAGSDPPVLRQLRELRASVALALVDLSDRRAEVVRRLEHAGIPVAAWLLLPEEEGYWLNARNVAQARERYDRFRAWTRRHALRWARVGVDIEPNIQEVRAARHNPWVVFTLLPRLLTSVESERRAYQALIDEIRADGYPVDAYVFPFVHQERLARTSALQRLTGMLDLRADREVCMLYSSFARPIGHALLDAYAAHFPAIAVGVTGGGVEEGVDPPPPLSWEELARDLRIASRHTDEIYLFSLEGCVRQGFLPRLAHFDWAAPAPIEERHRREAAAWLTRIDRALLVLRRPRYHALLAVLAALVPTAVAWALFRTFADGDQDPGS